MMCFPLEKYNFLSTFVETGTERGNGVKRALEAGFKTVHSVELAHNFYLGCVDKFFQDKRVNLYNGDCLDVLPILCRRIQEPVVFWLDAHVDNGYVENARHPCPLIAEIEIIGANRNGDDIILIDDRRKFNEVGDWGEGILEERVKELLRGVNPYSDIFYENGIEVNDIIASVPPKWKDQIK